MFIKEPLNVYTYNAILFLNVIFVQIILDSNNMKRLIIAAAIFLTSSWWEQPLWLLAESRLDPRDSYAATMCA